MTPALHALRRRLNAQAYDLVNEELARVDAENEALRAENELLRTRLSWAEDCAESWREDALVARFRREILPQLQAGELELAPLLVASAEHGIPSPLWGALRAHFGA